MKVFIGKIYKKLKFIWLKDLGYEFVDLCGVSLKAVKGTIRKRVDQDDAWFYYLAKHHSKIFDVGANVGYTALLALIQNRKKRYVLIDPNPLALADASKNLFINGYGNNASFYSSFVSNEENEQVKFYTIGTGAAGSMYESHAKTAADINSWSFANTTTIDALVKFYNFRPSLIKIDVEGAESLVLEGACELAKSKETIFFVEMHATKEVTMKCNAENVLKWCDEISYAAWYMAEATLMKKSEMIANRGKCHLLLLPKGLKYPSYLKEIRQGNPLPKYISKK